MPKPARWKRALRGQWERPERAHPSIIFGVIDGRYSYVFAYSLGAAGANERLNQVIILLGCFFCDGTYSPFQGRENHSARVG
jgi:hypothetical protein